MKSIDLLLFAVLIVLVNGHGWVNDPIPRGYVDNSENSASEQFPCGRGTSGLYEEIPYSVTAGDSIDVRFKTSDGHVGLICYFSLSFNDRGNFTQIGETIEDCVASNVYTESVTIPEDTEAGYAYLQWVWEAEDSTWYNCINLNVISPDFPMMELEEGIRHLLTCSTDQVTTVVMSKTTAVSQDTSQGITNSEVGTTTIVPQDETTIAPQVSTVNEAQVTTTAVLSQETTIAPKETTDVFQGTTTIAQETTLYSPDSTSTPETTAPVKRKRQMDETLSDESHEEIYQYDPLESQYYRVKLTTTIERDRFVLIEINNLGDYTLVAAASPYGLLTNLSLSEYTFVVEPQTSSSISMCLPDLTVRDMFVTVFGACSDDYEIIVKSYSAEIDFNLKSELDVEVPYGVMINIFSEATSSQQKSKRLVLYGSGSSYCSLSGPYMACGEPLLFPQSDNIRCIDLPYSFSQYDYGTGYYGITCDDDFSGNAQIERGKCIEWQEPLEEDLSIKLTLSLLFLCSIFL